MSSVPPKKLSVGLVDSNPTCTPPISKVSDIGQFDVGSLEMIIFGPMFSGKTTKLLNELTTCADVNLSVLYINHSDDNRDTEGSDGNVTTHSSQFKKLSSKVKAMKCSKLSDVDVDGFDVIGVDEGQFFNDLTETVRSWVLTHKKQVFIASLDGDADINPFGKTHELICLCQPGGLLKLSAHCMSCIKTEYPYRRMVKVPAGFTSRISAKEPHDQKDIGGADKYMATCLKCHQHF